jgi:uncharacterized protein (TIGR02271 family)
MADLDNARVVGDNGLRGIVIGPSDVPNEIAIELEDGTEISVPPSRLTLQPGGVWHLQQEGSSAESVIPVIAEELDIAKRKRVTGTVRVEKKSIPRDETVSMPLTSERAEVKRVVIGKPVDGPMPVRREGDTIIMPVVEEVAVVEKRLILKEEIHVTRRRTTEQHQETVTLHNEQAGIQRSDASGQPAATPPAQPASAPIPSEERSMIDPTKPRPNILSSRQKPAASKRGKLLDRS